MTEEAVITATESGWLVKGDVNCGNVVALRVQGDRLISRSLNDPIVVDLSAVTSSDTTGVSLLLRWLACANHQGKQIHYLSVPASLLKVAKICGVVSWLTNQHG